MSQTMKTLTDLSPLTLEEELLVLTQQCLPMIRAMISANNETRHRYTMGSSFWSDQLQIVLSRIEEIRCYLAMSLPHSYVYTKGQFYVSFEFQGWPTRSKKLARLNPCYFFVPDGWSIKLDSSPPTLKKLDKEDPKEAGFYGIQG